MNTSISVKYRGKTEYGGIQTEELVEKLFDAPAVQNTRSPSMTIQVTMEELAKYQAREGIFHEAVVNRGDYAPGMASEVHRPQIQ